MWCPSELVGSNSTDSDGKFKRVDLQELNPLLGRGLSVVSDNPFYAFVCDESSQGV